MRIMLRSKIALLFLTCALLLAIPAVAFADDVGNNLDNDIDATLETMNLTAGGSNGTAKIYVSPTQDGINGCNLKNAGEVTVNVSSDNTSVATVSPSSITIEDCRDLASIPADDAVTVTPQGPGSTTIRVTGPTTIVNGGDTGTFTYQANFTVNVAASAPSAPNAPTLTLAAASDSGDSNSDKKTNDDTPTFEGTAKAGSTVKVYDGTGAGATLLGSVTADATTGAWSFTVGSVDANQKLSEGTHTISATASDAGGTSTAATLSGVLIDKTAPAANCGSASTSWSASDANITCAPTDTGGLGLSTAAATLTPSSFNLVTSVPAGTETNNALTNSRDIYDVAGNKATAGPIGGNMVDKLAPKLSTCPAGGSFQLNSGLKSVGPIGYTEGGSGLDSTNSALSGQVDTSTVGEKSVTFTAKDNVDNAATPQTCKYNVNYVFSGFLQPINNTAHQTGADVSTFKAGSTVPVKFKLTDANGNVVQPVSAQWLTPLKGSATSQAVDEDIYNLSATTGGLYRWDATAQQSIYNWSTKGSSSGCYYRIGVQLDDGQTYYQNISLK
jgi:hypothetical protein